MSPTVTGSTAGQSGGSSVAALLQRMRLGDPDAVGEFVRLYGDRIRRRVRGRMLQSDGRLFDSEDIVSTVSRRLVGMVQERSVRAETEAELWSLVMTISRNALTTKGMAGKKVRIFEGEWLSPVGGWRQADPAAAPELDSEQLEDVVAAVEGLEDPVDRRMCRHWLDGKSLAEIARAMGMNSSTVRWRWSRIKDRIREALEGP